jgi:AcrR family transcriptional regulator
VTAAPTPRRSARKAKGDGHLRRGEILEAAGRIFLAHGHQGATMRRIAEAAGVSSTALYKHFPDKDAMLQEICQQTLGELIARNLEIAARPAGAESRVMAMLEAYLRWGLSHPQAYSLVYASPTGPGMWSERTTDLSRRAYEIYRDVVREIATAGRLRAGDADVAAQTTWMACHGMVSLLVARPGFDWASADTLIATMLETLAGGLTG